MTEFIYFLGRFHVLVLHLPIGMLILTIVLDMLSVRPGYSYLSQALPLCWAGTALSAVLTVVLGLMHFSEGGFDGPSASAHRNYGISVAVVSLLVWFAVACLPALYRQGRIVTNILLLFLVTMTGHYGGNLTHGSTYLVEYAPQPLRAMAGLAPRRAAVTDFAQADPWHDVVSPMLESRCLSCHNADKQRGQLDLSSLDALLVGGESGSVVLSGNAEGSDLFRRVNLPESHEDFMPAEGKTPLTESQVEILGWWIDSGLPVNTAIANVAIDSTVSELIAVELGLSAPAADMFVLTYPAADPTVLEQLVSQGWLVRPLLKDSNGLVVSSFSPGQAVTRDMLETLSQVSASLVDLDLASTGLTDNLVALLADMPVLETLNLSNNGLTDIGLQTLAGYKQLTVLNLYGNTGITDAGLNALTGLEHLESLYLWGTATTSDGVASLQAAIPALAVHGQSVLAPVAVVDE